VLAVGHVALGYLFGKSVGYLTGRRPSLLLLWVFSVLPDLDLLLPFLEHRGPSHSLVLMGALSLPFLIWNWRIMLPYLASSLSHSLVGDYFTGGALMFWPLSSAWVKSPLGLSMASVSEWYLELVLAGVFMMLLVFSKDYRVLLRSSKLDFRFSLLFLPLCVVVLPALLLFPRLIPRLLLLPHLLLIGLVLLPVLSAAVRHFKGLG